MAGLQWMRGPCVEKVLRPAAAIEGWRSNIDMAQRWSAPSRSSSVVSVILVVVLLHQLSVSCVLMSGRGLWASRSLLPLQKWRERVSGGGCRSMLEPLALPSSAISVLAGQNLSTWQFGRWGGGEP